MSARRDDLIRLAAETLGCVGQTAHGHWIYRDEPTGLWMVTVNSMVRLGKMVEADPVNGHDAWCSRVDSSVMEIDVGLIVRDRNITSDTDLDIEQDLADGEYEAGTSGNSMDRRDFKPERALLACLLLRFYRQDVVDTVRINEEIDRDRETDCEVAR
jgi:hypothetical protein